MKPYKTEAGQELYGYSQKNLELVYEQLKILKKIGIAAIILAFMFFCVGLYVLIMFQKYHILTDIIRRCVC